MLLGGTTEDEIKGKAEIIRTVDEERSELYAA